MRYLLATLRRWYARLSPTQDPGDDDREASGADEQWPEELSAMKNDLDRHPGFTDEHPVVPAPPDAYDVMLEEFLSKLYNLEDRCARECCRVMDALDPDMNATGAWPIVELAVAA